MGDLIKILAQNQKYLKIANIEKKLGWTPTTLTRMIARKEIPEKYKSTIEKWWDEFVYSLQEQSMIKRSLIFAEPENPSTVKIEMSLENNSINYTEYDNHKFKNNISLCEYNFKEDKYLMIEKYTKYPTKNTPVNKFEKVKWLKEKREADNQIKLAWEQFKK